MSGTSKLRKEHHQAQFHALQPLHENSRRDQGSGLLSSSSTALEIFEFRCACCGGCFNDWKRHKHHPALFIRLPAPFRREEHTPHHTRCHLEAVCCSREAACVLRAAYSHEPRRLSRRLNLLRSSPFVRCNSNETPRRAVWLRRSVP